MKIPALIICLFAYILVSCTTNNNKDSEIELSQIKSPQVFTVNAPVAGNYPQGLFKYPYKVGTLENELFTQTIEWSPKINKTFSANTQYTAILTLEPVNRQHTFKGTTVDGINGLPANGVKDDIDIEIKDRSLIIRINFETTANENAAAQLIFSDDFEGTELDASKWEKCPEWDRQGRSTWKDDMVLVSDGFLHLKFKRDPELGKEKTNNKTLADNWIRAGAVRTRRQQWPQWNMLFENNFGYYEAKIKFPVVSGTWGAFWLMSSTQNYTAYEGRDGTEIDIIETINNHKGEYNSALHWNGYDNRHKSTGSDGSPRPINIYDGNFHTFALDWSPSEYVFYIDDKVFWRADGGSKFNNSGINENLNYIKLSIESAPEWPGDIPKDFTEAEMLVDYVRVYNQPRN